MTPAPYVTGLVESLRDDTGRHLLSDVSGGIGGAELLAMTWRLARALGARGVRRATGVVCLTGNTVDAVVLRLACHVLGARYVGVQLGPATENLEHILADADAGLVVHDPDCVPPGEPVRVLAARAGLDHVSLGPAYGADDVLALAARHPAVPVPVAARAGDVAAVCYTSGTTGVPKGVVATFAGLAAASAAGAGFAATLPMPAGLRFLACTPVAYAVGDLVLDMLRLGVPVELLPGFDVSRAWAAIGRDGPVATFLYPAMLVRLAEDEDVRPEVRDNLFLAVYGSAPVSPRRLETAVRRLPSTAFVQGYAQTEVTSVCLLTPEDHVAGVTGRPHLLSSVGRPVPGVEIAIVGTDGARLDVGAVGEICVRSGSAMSGYWRRPELTASVLRDGWLHTGDVGRLDGDGYLYLVDRLRDMVIVDGRNCPAIPIEAALTGHPGVDQAAVVGVPSDATGEAVHAYVVRAPGPPVDADELRATVHDRLGPYHVPAAVRFVAEIPTTALGKPDKSRLRTGEPAWTGSY